MTRAAAKMKSIRGRAAEIMISITATSEYLGDLRCPIIKRETEQRSEEQLSLKERESAQDRVEFDIFAQARLIYARARSGRRTRSSNII